jgi:hypothetical protein
MLGLHLLCPQELFSACVRTARLMLCPVLRSIAPEWLRQEGGEIGIFLCTVSRHLVGPVRIDHAPQCEIRIEQSRVAYRNNRFGPEKWRSLGKSVNPTISTCYQKVWAMRASLIFMVFQRDPPNPFYRRVNSRFKSRRPSALRMSSTRATDATRGDWRSSRQGHFVHAQRLSTWLPQIVMHNLTEAEGKIAKDVNCGHDLEHRQFGDGCQCVG